MSLFLIEIAEEHDVVSEAGASVRCRHFNNEREYIVNECIERFVHEGFPGQVRHRFAKMSTLYTPIVLKVRTVCN